VAHHPFQTGTIAKCLSPALVALAAVASRRGVSSQAPIDPRRQDRLLFGAVLLFLAALVAAWYGLGVYAFGCGDVPSDVCGRKTLALAQFLVSLVGLVPAYLVARKVNRGQIRDAVRFLWIGVMIYFVWVVLNDAAVHGGLRL
jgi:hypothetical protein